MAVTALTPVLANKTQEDPRTETVFAKQFSGAENVKWTNLEDGFQKASFTLGGIRVEAYFNSEGELAGAVRNLFYSQLPLTIIQSVSSKFADAVVTEVREISNTEGTSYRIVLEQKDKKYSLKLNSQGEIIESVKTKKK